MGRKLYDRNIVWSILFLITLNASSQMDRSCGDWSTANSQEVMKYPTYNNMKEDQLDWSHFA